MAGLQADDLRVESAEDPAEQRLVLTFLGRSDARQPELVLRPFLGDQLTRAAQAGLAIEMRFEKMEYFNSSSITVFIKFVQDARQQQVKLTITYDGKARWQKLTFDALRIFERGDGLLKLVPV